METNLDILYIIFALHTETAIILGFCNPMISIIFEHKRLVAVAVNTKQCAPSGIMLHTSPILDRVERNVVPLKLYKWIIIGNTFQYYLLTTFSLCLAHQLLVLSICQHISPE